MEGYFTIKGNANLCEYIAEDLRDQVLDSGGIDGDIEISGNKECE